VEGGFTLDDFTVIEPTEDQPGSVTCPNGLTRPISRKRGVTFGSGCRDCPLRARCTTSKTGRSLTLHPRSTPSPGPIANAPRIRGSRLSTSQHRPMVERSISWLTTAGNRRLRYRGTTRNDQWLHHRVAGLNLRRLLMLGLIRTAGVWVIA
jgi:hypothetical protein